MTKNGKHIILDKPICTSLEELDEIERLSRENSLEVCCMLDLRYVLPAIKVKELIENGEIGQVKSVNFTGQHPLNYGVRPSWYFESGMHGGTINDIAIHGIDLIRFITGENLTDVKAAATWNSFADKEPHFKDCGQFMAQFGDVAVMADVSYTAPVFNGILPTYWDFCFWGTEGLIKFNYAEGNIHIYKSEERVIECNNPAPGYLDAFIDEIQGKKTIMDTEGVLASARQTLEIQAYADKEIK